MFTVKTPLQEQGAVFKTQRESRSILFECSFNNSKKQNCFLVCFHPRKKCRNLEICKESDKYNLKPWYDSIKQALNVLFPHLCDTILNAARLQPFSWLIVKLSPGAVYCFNTAQTDQLDTWQQSSIYHKTPNFTPSCQTHTLPVLNQHQPSQNPLPCQIKCHSVWNCVCVGVLCCLVRFHVKRDASHPDSSRGGPTAPKCHLYTNQTWQRFNTNTHSSISCDHNLRGRSGS